MCRAALGHEGEEVPLVGWLAGAARYSVTRPVPFTPPDLAQLRKKFEEDKQRIELMRAQRKFRPY